MPTFESIGVHPELRETLAKAEPPVETPQAFLSREPVGLAESIGVPIQQILDVRAAVADALVSEENNGQRALNIKATLKRHASATVSNTDEVSNKEKTASNSFLLGSVSALNLGLYESLCFAPEQHQRNFLSTGSSRLDQLLSFPKDFSNAAIVHPQKRHKRQVVSEDTSTGMGIPFGYVTQFAGRPASGKTQIALMTSAFHASAEKGPNVFYLASGMGHAAIVLARRLNHFCQRTKNANPIKGVSFFTIKNGYEALSALSYIEANIQQKILQSNNKSVTSSASKVLIVLDSASGCLSGDLYSAPRGGGISVTGEVACVLRRLARQYGAAVLVTNGTVSGDKNSLKAAMGKSWNAADLKLWLQVEDRTDLAGQQNNLPGLLLSTRKIVRATLEQHPAKALHRGISEGMTALFEITLTGISDGPSV